MPRQKSSNPRQKSSISLPQETLAAIALRGDERSSTIERDLHRYYYLLDAARRDLRAMLSDAEIGMILDVLNGTLIDSPFAVNIIPADIQDALPDGYAEKWDIDSPALVTKIEELDAWHLMALADAAERWWLRVGRGETGLPPADALKPAR